MVAVCVALIAYVALREVLAFRERRAVATERDQLLNRIQAPEMAVRQSVERPKGKRPIPLPLNDDTAYREAKERRMNGAY